MPDLLQRLWLLAAHFGSTLVVVHVCRSLLTALTRGAFGCAPPAGCESTSRFRRKVPRVPRLPPSYRQTGVARATGWRCCRWRGGRNRCGVATRSCAAPSLVERTACRRTCTAPTCTT